MLLLFAVVFIAAMGVLYAAYGFKKVRELPEGSSRMSEIAEAIRKGANTFLLYDLFWQYCLQYFCQYQVVLPL